MALVSASVSCSAPAPATMRVRVAVSAPSQSTGRLSNEVFNEVNLYRQRGGMSTLERHAGLDQLAQKHCDFLVATCGGRGTNINHLGFDKRAFDAGKYFRISSIGENVEASKIHSPKRLVGLCAASESHDRNMKSAWKYAGVATAMSDDGVLISTQVFGSEETNPMLVARNFARK